MAITETISRPFVCIAPGSKTPPAVPTVLVSFLSAPHSISAHRGAFKPADGYNSLAIGGICAILIRRSFSLAHLSDLHVALASLPAARTLLNKRLLGVASWWAHRRRAFRPEILDALLDDLIDRVCLRFAFEVGVNF